MQVTMLLDKDIVNERRVGKEGVGGRRGGSSVFLLRRIGRNMGLFLSL